MNMKYAARVGDSDTYIAIAQVKEVLGSVHAHIQFKEGKTSSYILLDSSGEFFDLDEDLFDGDSVLVRFALQDQFARLIPMDELADRLLDQRQKR